MKKCLLMALCALVFLWTLSSASAEDSWVIQIQEDGTAAISGYQGTLSNHISIPDSVDGTPVTAIRAEILQSIPAGSIVTIPMRVTGIEKGAFPDNTVIQAYSGADALRYARDEGLDFRSLSEFDFQDTVRDLSGVNWHAQGSGVSLARADALALRQGDVIYLPRNEGLLQQHLYTISAIHYQGSTAQLSVSLCEGLEYLKSYHVSVQNEPVVFQNYALASKGISIGSILDETSVEQELTVECSLGDVTTSVTLTYSATLDAAYDYDENMGKLPSGRMVLNETIRIKADGDLSHASEEKLKGQILKGEGSSGDDELPLVNYVVPIGSTGLTVTGSVGIKLEALLTGEIDYTIARRRGYIWNGGMKQEINEQEHIDDGNTVLKAVGSVGVSITGKVGMDFIFLSDVANASVSAGIMMTVTADSEQQYDPNLICFDIEVTANFTLKASLSLTVGVDVNFKPLKGKLKYEILKVESKIVDEKIKLAAIHAEFNHAAKAGHRWTLLHECSVPPELKRTFHFHSGTEEEIDDIKVLVGNRVNKPKDPMLLNDRVQFLGWYTELEEGVDFFGDQTYVIAAENMERETTLYARYSAPYRKITIDPNDERMKPEERYQIQGSRLVEVIPPLKMNYRFLGFLYTTPEGLQKTWDFQTDVVGEFDLVLTGQWEYDPEYNPFEESVNAILQDEETWDQMCGDLVMNPNMSTGMIPLVNHPNWDTLSNVAFCTGYEGNSPVVIIPEKHGLLPVTIVDGSGFENKDNLTMLVVPATVQYITGFNDCPNLQVVILKSNHLEMMTTGNKRLYFDGVIKIYGDCFRDCPSLREIQLPSSGSLQYIGRQAFKNTQLYTLNIPEGVTELGVSAFEGCTNLQAVTLPHSLTALPKWAFYNCHELSKLEGLDHITALGEAALTFTAMKFVRMNDVVSIGDNNFVGCSELQTLEIHMAENAGTGYSSSIMGNPKLTDLFLDGLHSHISHCESLTSARIRSEGWNMSIENTDNLPALRNLELTGSWTSVSIVNCPNLQGVYIEKLTQGENAPGVLLQQCPKLADFRIEDYGDGIPRGDHGLQLQSVRYSMYNVGLSSLDLADLRPVIKLSTFQKLPNLKKLIIPEWWTSISTNMFSGNSALEQLILPGSLESIGRYAFSGASSLRQVELPDSLEKIEYGAFQGTGITSVKLPAGVTVAPGDAFSSSLSEIVLAEEWESFEPDSGFRSPRLCRLTVLGDETELGLTRAPDNLFVIACSRNSRAWQAAENKGSVILLDLNSPEVGQRVVRFSTSSGGMLADASHRWARSAAEGLQHTLYALYEEGETIRLPEIYLDNATVVCVEWRECSPYDTSSYIPANQILVANGDRTLYAKVLDIKAMPITWRAANHGIYITGDNDSAGNDLVIPERIWDMPVIGIDDYALDGDYYSVVLPRTLEYVSPLAFARCRNLDTVYVNSDKFVSVDGVLYAVDPSHQPQELVFCPRERENALIIPEGVSSIRDGAVAFCSKLNQVSLPTTLKSIGKNNFSVCGGLTDLVIPAQTDSLGEGCLTGCDALVKVTFLGDCDPDPTVGLGCSANLRFYGPIGAEKLTDWADNASKKYNLYEITFVDGEAQQTETVRAGASLEDYEPIDRVGYAFVGWSGETEEALLTDAPAENLKLYAVWKRILILEEDTLTGTDLEAGSELVVPYGTVKIAAGAVTVPLASVRIPSTVTVIQDGAFTEVALILGDQGTAAEQYALEHGIPFREEEHTLSFAPGEGTVLEPIHGTTGSEILLPVPSRTWASFAGWFSDAGLTQPFTANTMPDHDMTLYAAWEAAQVSDFLTEEKEDGTLTLIGYQGTDYFLRIPAQIGGKTVTEIGSSAFAMNQTVGQLNVPETVTLVQHNAFNGCGIQQLIFEGESTELSRMALAGMRSLTKLTLPAELKRIPEGLLWGCRSLVDLTLPDSVEIIGKDAFRGCEFLRSLKLPGSLTEFRPEIFGNTRIRTIIAAEDHPVYRVEGQLLLSRDGKELVYVCPREFGSELRIPDSVEKICARACAELDLLSELMLPDTLREIGDEAFANCPALQTVEIPASVTVFGRDIFGDSNLTIYTSSRANAAYGLREQYRVVIPSEDTEAASLTLNLTSLSLHQGLSCKLTAEFLPEETTDKDVTWTTSDAEIAAVNSDGVVTGMGEGTATICATAANGISAACEVTVSGTLVELSLKNMAYPARTGDGKLCLSFGKYYAFQVAGMSGYTFTVSSDSPYVQIIQPQTNTRHFKLTDSSGNADGVPVTIHVHAERSGGEFIDQEMNVYACKAIQSSRLSSTLVVFPGAVKNGVYADDCFLNRETGHGLRISDPDILEVREGGILWAKKPGKAQVTYRDETTFWRSFITVEEPHCDLQVSAEKTILFNGQTMQLNVTCSDPGCELSYSSSHGSLPVSETGLITCINEYGNSFSSLIIVRAAKNGIPQAQASILIQTDQAVSNVRLWAVYSDAFHYDTNIYEVEAGDRRDLLIYDEGNRESVIFRSSDPSVISIVDGYATALRSGTATIQYTLSKGTTGEITIHVRETLMATLILPSALQVVDTEAFRGNTAIQRVVLGDQVIRVEAYAYADCSQLQIVEFRNGNCQVDPTAFEGCDPELKFYCPAGSGLAQQLRGYGWTVQER